MSAEAISRDDLLPYLDMSEGELLSELGAAVSSTTMFAQKLKPEDYIVLATSWIRRNSATIKENVCGSAIAEALSSISDDDNISIALAITDMLLGLYGKEQILLLSVFIAKNGMRRFCNGY